MWKSPITVFIKLRQYCADCWLIAAHLVRDLAVRNAVGQPTPNLLPML